MNRHLIILYTINFILTGFIIYFAFFDDGTMQTDRSTKARSLSQILVTKTGNTHAAGKKTTAPSDAGLLHRTAENKSQECSPGQFMIGIRVDGSIVCAAFDAGSVGNNGSECHHHGFIEDGFCECDEGWTGPECQQEMPPPGPDTPPDNDKDNHPQPFDCDDNDDLVYPGAPDAVDGKDNDCDGEIDEGY